MHDGNHGAFSKNVYINRAAGFCCDLIGASSYVWHHEHNIGHHQFTNSMQDPDAMAGSPFIRYHPNQKWSPRHRFQFLYTWFAYFAVAFKWYVSDYGYYYSGEYRGIKMYKPSTLEFIVFVMGKIQVIFWVFLVPAYLHRSLYAAVFLPLLCFAFVGIFFALHFAPTHLADDVVFPEEFKNETDWAKLQVLTTSNYAMDSTIATWCSAGLNFQVEHHLFPTIAHTYYPAIAPIVQKTCKEFGMPYFAHDTYFDAVKHHFLHLWRMGINPDDSKPYKLQNTDWSRFGL
eukprot:TRINITY_DN3871_c0_g1_i2.p2 TRINITY_DN3871_c0_g1~~TRINITY_DN3871_c0_g1_i2.p2  ORF type:complete len:287 (-),score=21.38 TRINITY_DN3871_c0_g1_i2:372-1232(-)